MTKKKATETPLRSAFQLDAAMSKAMLDISVTIKGSGFIPHVELRERFGDRPFTIFSAMAYRDYRIVREVRRQIGPTADDAVLGYEWADRRFSNSETKQMGPDAQWMLDPLIVTKGGTRYADYRNARFACRFTNFAVAGLPVTESDKQRVFERVNGHVLLPAYGVRAMLKKALPLIGKTQALADNIRAAAVRIPVDKLGLKLLPVVDERAHQGKGVTEHERLEPGTLFTLDLWYPSSEISLEELVTVLSIAGRVVRLSPARSSGYGEFEVTHVNGEPLTGVTE